MAIIVARKREQRLLLRLGVLAASNIANKITAFEKHYPTRKNLSFVLITTYGMKKSIWSEQLIDEVISIDSLFE